MAIRFLTKQQMVQKLSELVQEGWIKSIRPLNAGGIGNTIDSLLGLTENNLPISDTAQWELKTHRTGSSSLLTLFHMEPEPRKDKIVTNILLPKYGWPDQKRDNELSFRQTIQATHFTDRGFGILVNKKSEQLQINFDYKKVQQHHSDWLESVKDRVGLGQINPQPFWDFKEVFLKASTKLLNAFYVEAESKKEKTVKYFKISRIWILQSFDIDYFINAIENGSVLIDFDARSHHNHGTKFRLRQDKIPSLYRYSEQASPSANKISEKSIKYNPIAPRLF